jgi:hypothetical protein
MNFYHSTVSPISKVGTHGTFGSHLFATPNFQRMYGHTVYCMDVSDEEICQAWQILDREVDGNMRGHVAEVRQIMTALLGELPEDFNDWDAEALITEHRRVNDYVDEDELEGDEAGMEAMHEAWWDIQRVTAEAARTAGFRAVWVSDENYTSLMIDMLGRELRVVTGEEEDE